MNKNAFELIDKLEKYNGLELDEYTALAESFDKDTAEYAAQKADKVRKKSTEIRFISADLSK